MAIVVDSENVVNRIEQARDRLRAEIGTYYTNENQRFILANFRSGIGENFYTMADFVEPSGQQLIPTKKTRIYLSGREDQFRDQIQWNDYIRQTISTNVAFLDHQFSFINTSETISDNSHLVKNYHDPTYEDITKTTESNLLLNYNLISYPHKSRAKSVAKIGDLKTTFDQQDYIVDSQPMFDELKREFPNRILNYSGSINEIDQKQRHIFDLQVETEIDQASMSIVGEPLVPIESFPYYYTKYLPPFSGGDTQTRRFSLLLNRNKKRKNIFQGIKQNLAFANRAFNIEGVSVQAQIHNLINLVMTTRIIGLTEASDELFLVRSNETDFDDITSRFADQIDAINFLSEMREFIRDNSRAPEDIVEGPTKSCKIFFLGYKIEKYLDSDVGQPIQTYYTNDRYFYDTQIKYGRQYIYKTKMLVGVLGSSYTYTNLFVSQNNFEMASEFGEKTLTFPPGYSGISNEKYRAYVDVEATPSFQVIEYLVETDNIAFVDAPTLPPQVEYRNNSKKANVEFFFSPMFGRVNSVRPNPTTPEELIRPLRPLTEQDQRIADLIDNDEMVNMDYFSGIYEVYRFADHFLTRVDDPEDLISAKNQQGFMDNLNAHFEDFIIPHKKYYYAFRTLTYHGTPSNLTVPFEVELLRDSDEFKINVSQYKYPEQNKHTYQKAAKRIIKIIPNIERLTFDSVDEQNKHAFTLDENGVLVRGHTQKIKIRVTSKHTGKKIDINLNLKLINDESSFTQN